MRFQSDNHEGCLNIIKGRKGLKKTIKDVISIYKESENIFR